MYDTGFCFFFTVSVRGAFINFIDIIIIDKTQKNILKLIIPTDNKIFSAASMLE